VLLPWSMWAMMEKLRMCCMEGGEQNGRALAGAPEACAQGAG